MITKFSLVGYYDSPVKNQSFKFFYIIKYKFILIPLQCKTITKPDDVTIINYFI